MKIPQIPFSACYNEMRQKSLNNEWTSHSNSRSSFLPVQCCGQLSMTKGKGAVVTFVQFTLESQVRQTSLTVWNLKHRVCHGRGTEFHKSSLQLFCLLHCSFSHQNGIYGIVDCFLSNQERGKYTFTYSNFLHRNHATTNCI